MAKVKIPKGFQIPDIGGADVPKLFPASLTGKGTRGNEKGKFVPVDPNAIEKLAVQFDTKGYNLSDADFAKRFPQLVAGRDYNIASAETNLAGHPDQNVTSALQQSGLGDVNLGQGSAIARNMGVPIAAKEARDRNYFQTLFADNPQRAFGLNSQDIAHIALANTNGVNVQNQGAFGSRLNQYVANTQQNAQTQAALIGGLGSLAGAGIKAVGNQYLQPSGYGNYAGAIPSDVSASTGDMGGGTDSSGGI